MKNLLLTYFNICKKYDVLGSNPKFGIFIIFIIQFHFLLKFQNYVNIHMLTIKKFALKNLCYRLYLSLPSETRELIFYQGDSIRLATLIKCTPWVGLYLLYYNDVRSVLIGKIKSYKNLALPKM